ncbi:MAG: hypothetical protein KGO53_02595 [Alphaproteobacteria bacterium]|nr:hypothetical protein [Alphaproteobacteria bacterium]
MAIKKQDFYEGAALYQLVRTNKVERIVYAQPYFILNDRLALLLKYSTSKDSPWNFVFSQAELSELNNTDSHFDYYAALICGSDGVVALTKWQVGTLIGETSAASRIGCYRKHDHHYLVKGPNGPLDRKISRSNWMNILGEGADA